MKLLASILCVWATWAGAASSSIAPLQQPSVFWDARYARRAEAVVTNIEMRVELPPGKHAGFTCTAWVRLRNTNSPNFHMTTRAFWCPDAVIKTAPDLLAGAGAHGIAGGTNLTDIGGVITVSSFPFATYEAAHLASVTNRWKRGVYTIDGWASNAVTVGLGGSDISVGPGSFNRNAEPGASDAVTISGSGPVSIGISKTPCYRYFDEIDGVAEGNVFVAGRVTNELSFCSWRFEISGSNQLYRSDLGTMESFTVLSLVKTNAMPLDECFDSRGDYRIGLFGLAAPKFDFELFDTRVLPWCLSNSELERVHFNGATEIQRRGIPQWR